MIALVPAESVPAATALEMAVASVATVSPAAALKTKVLPVVASLTVVTEPAVNAVEVDRGLATDPVVEVKVDEAATKGGVLLAEPPKT
jgi:hypothetical protein